MSKMKSTSLDITLGYGFAATIGSTLEVLANAVQDSTMTSEPNLAGSVLILAPSNPPNPVATLIAPQTIGSCGTIELTTSGSSGAAGRAFTYMWTYPENVNSNSGNPNKNTVNAALSSSSASPNIILATSNFQRGRHTINVVIVNWLGNSASANVTFTKREDVVPVISPPPPIPTSRRDSMIRCRLRHRSSHQNAVLPPTTPPPHTRSPGLGNN
mmetsp:Transcript_8346/g.20498  ORF Transcript_8346/g.20498 Transcript_8346/m.20498 type:complete len:214 (+) Transcript_8346:319-960(+)